jgi:hypothetical protein
MLIESFETEDSTSLIVILSNLLIVFWLTMIRRKFVSPISGFTEGPLRIKRNHGFLIIRTTRSEQAETLQVSHKATPKVFREQAA